MPDRDILLILAEGLPDAVLRDLFPGRKPGQIRDIIRRLAASPDAPPAAEKGAVSRPSRLKPGEGRCILYTDGASRGNPGEAGAGVVLQDGWGRELATRSLYLGHCTNNSAEYKALIAGLELAVEHGCGRLEVLLDSELLVRQVSGRYRVRNIELQLLHRQVMDLLSRLEEWRISHVPRAENARADRLANQGIDLRPGRSSRAVEAGE